MLNSLPALALLAGAALALLWGNPYLARTKAITPKLLSISVIGLGAGMDLGVIARVGLHGLGYTAFGITLTMGVGILLGRLMKTEPAASLLLCAGTAICGGSAIAALAPTIRARSESVSVALGTVFLFNAVALIAFPPLGHALDLTQAQFGLWSALAIHDTSSVVGATVQYGAEAAQIGTTLKLARALWIVPLTLVVGYANRKRGSAGVRPKRPWFILGFVLAAALVTWVPELREAGHGVEAVARKLLVLTLFLIGANLTRDTLRAVGARPLVQGFLLWIGVASATLAAVTSRIIS